MSWVDTSHFLQEGGLEERSLCALTLTECNSQFSECLITKALVGGDREVLQKEGRSHSMVFLLLVVDTM